LNIYYFDTASGQPFGGLYLDAFCLIDTTADIRPPTFLVGNMRLAIIQVASPNPFQKEWGKRRIGIREFVLNPPEEAELIEASGSFSLIFH
jgi:hypothetical protein